MRLASCVGVSLCCLYDCYCDIRDWRFASGISWEWAWVVRMTRGEAWGGIGGTRWSGGGLSREDCGGVWGILFAI